MDIDDEKETHEEGLETLHNQYHQYKLRFSARNREPLDYLDWLEHTAVRQAERLGEATETIDCLEDERDRYQHAAECNHALWVEATQQKNALYGLLAAARAYSMVGNLSEISRLLLHWASWN